MSGLYIKQHSLVRHVFGWIFAFVAILFFTQSVQAADEKQHSGSTEVINKVAETLIQLEGFALNTKETQQVNHLAQALFEALGSEKGDISPSELFESLGAISDKKVRDIIFVYGLMALALEDKANEARGKLQRYDLALTYMDEMPTKDDEVLGFAYGGSSRLPDCSQIVV